MTLIEKIKFWLSDYKFDLINAFRVLLGCFDELYLTIIDFVSDPNIYDLFHLVEVLFRILWLLAIFAIFIALIVLSVVATTLLIISYLDDFIIRFKYWLRKFK